MDAIFLTGDAPVGGKRERDLRLKGEFEGPAGGVSERNEEHQGVSQAMFAGVDPDLNWEDIPYVPCDAERSSFVSPNVKLKGKLTYTGGSAL